MSDSEDDFMSDKYLVAASAQAEPPPSSSTTYSARRSAAALRSMRAGQAKNMVSARQTEEHRRRQGLATSLFDEPRSGAGTPQDDRERRQPGGSGGGAKAMEMMMKMGWKVGQGLGRKRSPSPDSSSKLPKADHHAELDSEPSRRGIGSSSKQPARTEPIRISLWSGRRGISARSPSPPPLPDPSGPSPDSLDPKKLERLGKETEDFRARQRREFGEKEAERKSSKARDMLVRFDEERGVKFHPLHVLPSDPLSTLPRPLLELIYPSQALSPSPTSRSPSPIPPPASERAANVSAAERLREQMRRDMLQQVEGEDDLLVLGNPPIREPEESEQSVEGQGQGQMAVDWEEMVSGTKRVLKMEPLTYLTYLISQLRHEHLFCFWCAYKYTSYDEMDGPGGCPGDEEDDH